jgi:hypothetical protein
MAVCRTARYNAMVDHGCVRYGTPLDPGTLAQFRHAVLYRIGTMDFSLDLLYHVVFRGNDRCVCVSAT